MARYINPFSDWSFKRIFGQEYSKDLLIEFLNQLLLGEQHITDVKFKDKEMLPETKDQRGIIYDVFCETDTGEHIIVEMQNRSQSYFIDRSLYYASKTIVDQGIKGKWDYHLTPVYVICFMNFDVDENTPKKFRTDVVLADKDSGEVYSNKIRFIYLVMPLFKKKEEECTTFLDCWIYNLKHMETLEKMPFEAQHKIFKRLAEIADSKSLTKEEQEKYDNSMMVMWDNYAVYKHAVEKAYKKGYEEERKKVSKKVALKLLAYNTPIDVIAKSTGLSIDEIKKYVQDQLTDNIWEEEQRFENPHNHYLDMSPAYYDMKMSLLHKLTD